MSAILAAIASKVVMAILGVIAGWVAKTWHHAQQDKKADDLAKETTAPLEQAKTGKEIDDATDSAIGHL